MTLNWNNASWLAARQIRDTWIGYLLSPLYFAFLGSVIATDDTILQSIVLPLLMMILMQATFSSRYFSMNMDNEVLRHQMFLHSLPLEFGTIVIARAMSMLTAGVINTPVFFIWFWFLGPGFTTIPNFLAWCAFWVGLSFVGLGFSLVQEFNLNLRNWTIQNSIIIAIFLVVVTPLLWITDSRPVDWTYTQAHNHPWLLALAGLAMAIAGCAIGIRLAVRGFRNRDFTT